MSPLRSSERNRSKMRASFLSRLTTANSCSPLFSRLRPSPTNLRIPFPLNVQVTSFLLLALVQAFAPQAFAQNSISINNLPGLSNYSFILRGQSLTPNQFPATEIPLREYNIQEGDNAWTLLRRHGLEPTAGAYKVFKGSKP